MRVDSIHPNALGGTGQSAEKLPDSAEEAARQFERVLVKQLVSSMTKELFNESLAGDDAPSWMGAYGDMQRDSMTDILADHLVDSGALRLRDLLMRQWALNAASTDTQTENE